MKQDEIRQKLIDGTIHVIARDGLDKATTKSIGEETSINQAYIYRHFKNKEDMFAQTFSYLDDDLLSVTTKYCEVMYMQSLDFQKRCRFYFSAVWECLLEDHDQCLAYVQYFYSPYFKKYSYETHKSRFKPLVEEFGKAFIEEADVWMILNHILNVMLDFAVKVHNGQMSGNDDYSEHVFRVVYESVKQYFKMTQESEA